MNSPIVENNSIFVQTRNNIYKIDLNGNVVWDYSINANNEFISPEINENEILVQFFF